MRFIGNKTRILPHIKNLMDEHELNTGTFVDLFAGSGSVGDYFKDKFKIISNDMLYCTSVFAEAKTSYGLPPSFDKFQKEYKMSPYDYWNSYDYSKEKPGFITLEYSPQGNRKFFKEKNAIKIDVIRRQLEELYNENIFTRKEYIYLLASLMESVMRISNTSGTYEAFFNDWERRSYNDFVLEPLEMEHIPLYSSENITYNKDANELVKEISGDIVYIDPPYTVTQYASAYHVLETIALYDNPEIRGKTGRRTGRKMSEYSRRQRAKYVFEDLLRKLEFDHVVISYSNQSLIPFEEFTELLSLFAIDNELHIKGIPYREYRNLNASQKGNGKQLKEYLIYFKKAKTHNKSPLNYAGSKSSILETITNELPEHITNFVDVMGGAFNVGANIIVTDKVYYNDNNEKIHEIIKLLLTTDKEVFINDIKAIIDDYSLSREGKTNYMKLRNDYNKKPIGEKNPLKLFVLILYSFQHMIRFNSKGEFNVPIGNSGLTDNVIERIHNFTPKSKLGKLFNMSFEDLDIEQFDKDTLFYFDPPYIITSAAYNDGKRFRAEWTDRNEIDLLNFLEKIDSKGQKFLLSNVIEHKGKTNDLLVEWVESNNYDMKVIGKTGRRYPRIEVLIDNYN